MDASWPVWETNAQRHRRIADENYAARRHGHVIEGIRSIADKLDAIAAGCEQTEELRAHQERVRRMVDALPRVPGGRA